LGKKRGKRETTVMWGNEVKEALAAIFLKKKKKRPNRSRKSRGKEETSSDGLGRIERGFNFAREKKRREPSAS